MRRSALLGLALFLSGCQFAGNPFDGFGGFLGDTHGFKANPNLPAGSEETMQRVEGRDVTVEPLLPEPGNVWPGPMKPLPTMQELQQQQNTQPLPAPNVPAKPPPLLFPGEMPQQPQTPGATQTYPTPNGPAITTENPNGIRTFTAPGGGQGIVVPNGNGTSTLIGPNGSITTVPTPK